MNRTCLGQEMREIAAKRARRKAGTGVRSRETLIPPQRESSSLRNGLFYWYMKYRPDFVDAMKHRQKSFSTKMTNYFNHTGPAAKKISDFLPSTEYDRRSQPEA